MKIIIDTHIFLFALADPGKIPQTQRAALKTLSNTVYVSAVSVAEIAIKASIGKLIVAFDPVKMIDKSGFEKLDFRCEDAIALKEMPYHHKDPFDRMLIAQSMARNYPILTVDEKFQAYECELV